MRLSIPVLSNRHSGGKAQSCSAFLAFCFGSVLMISASQSQADVSSLYVDSCAACHDSGALNAPKKGDSARWEALKKQKGMPALVKSVKGGMKQMPAGGLCAQCNDADYQALIDYMSR